MRLAEITGIVTSIEAATAVAPIKIRMTLNYSSSNILGSLTVDLPIEKALDVHIGQRIVIGLDIEKPPSEKP